MADEKKLNHTWSKTPTLKKIKVGGSDYWLKDDEARGAIDALEVAVGSAASDLAAEVSARIAADATLQANINAEATARLNADATLQANINAEATSRGTMDAALSARIDNLESRGRYLSGWDCSTGKPDSYPVIEVGVTYKYKAGDYFIVSKVAASGNKKPAGPGITRTGESAYTVPTADEASEVQVGDIYTFDGENFVLTHTPVVQDTNQKVKVGDVTFGPNAVVNFVGEGAVTIEGSNVDGAEKIVIKASDHITTVEAAGSGNVVTAMVASDGNITYTKGITVEDGAQVNVIEKVKVGGSELTITDKAVDIEVQAAGSLALKDLASFADLASDAQGKINEKSIVTIASEGSSEENAKYITVNGSEYKLGDVDKSYVDAELSKKVDKVAGSRLMTEAEGSKLAGIASGAQVNVIEKIKLNGSDLTPDADKRIDLGDIAVTSNVVADVSYDDSAHTLKQKKGTADPVAVHVFGALAEKASASGTVAGQTITGIKATGTSTGDIAVELSYTATEMQSTGSFTPAGVVEVVLKDNVVQSMKAEGTVPYFTDGKVGTFTAAVYGSDHFNAGSLPAIDATKFNGGSLSAAASAQFAQEGIVASIGSDETLVFADASKANAVTAQGTLTPASIGDGFFSAGSLPTYSHDGFNGGSWTAGTFNAGAMPTFEAITVGVSEATFTGSEAAVAVKGNYDKASVKSATFTGKAIELDVGNIVISDKDVTVQ